MPASSLVTAVYHGVALQEVNVVHSCHDEFQQVQVIQKTLIQLLLNLVLNISSVSISIEATAPNLFSVLINS